MEKKHTADYQVYKYTPPDCHELVAEVKNAGVAQWKVYQLDTLLTPEARKKGVFHYRWPQLDTSEHEPG